MKDIPCQQCQRYEKAIIHACEQVMKKTDQKVFNADGMSTIILGMDRQLKENYKIQDKLRKEISRLLKEINNAK